MAEIRESDVYAALGMEVPGQTPGAAAPAVAGEGANEPGPADPERAENQNTETQDGDAPHPSPAATPAPEAEGLGDEGRGGPLGSAAPTETEAEDAGDGEAGGGETDSSPAAQNDRDGKGAMSRAERAEQARLRRERETQEKIDAAVARALETERAKHAEELKGIFAQAGMTDRYNGGKPITSKEEFDAWQDRARTERLSRQLRDGSLTPEAFQQAVDASPTVRAAKDFMDRMEAAEQERKARETEARFKEQVAAELTEIRKLNPGVKSLEDIMRMETGPRFAQLVRERGMSYLEAFQLANMDDILKAGSMAAAEGAARQQHSKDHLRSSAGVGAVPREVPRAVVMQYRELFPDWTMEQIRADYIKRMQ